MQKLNLENISSVKLQEEKPEYEYETRFKFVLNWIDENPENNKELGGFNFYAKPKMDWESGENGFQNSWEIVYAFQSIVGIFQKYMKNLSCDNIEYGYENHFSPSNQLNKKCFYELKLVDFKFPKEKVVFETMLSAEDFLYDPTKFPLSIIQIWKDGEKKGIRTILKECLQLQKYSNRFNTVKMPKNNISVNQYESIF